MSATEVLEPRAPPNLQLTAAGHVAEVQVVRQEAMTTRQGEKAHANKTNYKANYPDRRNETDDRCRGF
jgi:hypothetical protein